MVIGYILCATRGGKDRIHTRDAAITLAKDRGDTRVLILAANPHFLDTTAAPTVVDTVGEITNIVIQTKLQIT